MSNKKEGRYKSYGFISVPLLLLFFTHTFSDIYILCLLFLFLMQYQCILFLVLGYCDGLGYDARSVQGSTNRVSTGSRPIFYVVRRSLEAVGLLFLLGSNDVGEGRQASSLHGGGRIEAFSSAASSSSVPARVFASPVAVRVHLERLDRGGGCVLTFLLGVKICPEFIPQYGCLRVDDPILRSLPAGDMEFAPSRMGKYETAKIQISSSINAIVATHNIVFHTRSSKY